MASRRRLPCRAEGARYVFRPRQLSFRQAIKFDLIPSWLLDQKDTTPTSSIISATPLSPPALAPGPALPVWVLRLHPEAGRHAWALLNTTVPVTPTRNPSCTRSDYDQHTVNPRAITFNSSGIPVPTSLVPSVRGRNLSTLTATAPGTNPVMPTLSHILESLNRARLAISPLTH